MNNYNRILVEQTGGWIGDMILLTPALRAIKTAFPSTHISMLVRPLVAELMRRNPYVNEVIVYDKRGKQSGILQFWRLAQNLKRLNFDLAVILHPNSTRSAFLAYLARIPERIGGSKEGGLFLTRKTEFKPDIHEVERYLNVIRLIGIEPSDTSLEFWMGERDRTYASSLLEELGVSDKTSLVGINPFTTWRSKSWDLEKFANLINHISDELQLQAIVTGPKDGVEAGMKLEKLTKVPFFNAIGKTDIFQLGALIEKCSLYISPDSAPMHLAAAVKTHTIALFGSTSPIRHAPYGKNHISLEKELNCRPCYKPTCNIGYLCMKRIEVIEVIKAIQELLLIGGTDGSSSDLIFPSPSEGEGRGEG